MYALIVIYGRVPPPLGGVSVFCKRRIEWLSQNGHEVIHFDSGNIFNLFKLIIFSIAELYVKKRELTIEVNVSNVFVLFILSFSFISKKIKFIDHNGSRNLVNSKWKRRVLWLFSKRVQEIAVVNERLKRNYPSKLKDKIVVESPFILPSNTEIIDAEKAFPSSAKHLLELVDRKIILMSAWKPVLTDNHEDLYGIFNTLQVFEELLPTLSEFQFVIMIGEFANDEFSDSVRRKIIKLNSMHDNLTFITGGISQLPLLPKTLVLLRLTLTDGDSVSVREALSMGTSVITTDVTSRPQGAITVPVGDIDGVKQRLLEITQ